MVSLLSTHFSLTQFIAENKAWIAFFAAIFLILTGIACFFHKDECQKAADEVSDQLENILLQKDFYPSAMENLTEKCYWVAQCGAENPQKLNMRSRFKFDHILTDSEFLISACSYLRLVEGEAEGCVRTVRKCLMEKLNSDVEKENTKSTCESHLDVCTSELENTTNCNKEAAEYIRDNIDALKMMDCAEKISFRDTSLTYLAHSQ